MLHNRLFKDLSITSTALAFLAGAAAGPSAANAQNTWINFYSNNFETGLGSEWSSNSVRQVNVTNFSSFNGRYNRSWTCLHLAQPNGGVPPTGGLVLLPPGGGGSGGGGGGGGGGSGGGGGGLSYLYRVTFDLFVIDSWDGTEATYGPDAMRLRMNANNIWQQTFTNQLGNLQSFTAPTVGPVALGYTPQFLDSIYRDITVEFTAPVGSDFYLTWEDTLGQGMSDESWGIDNVRVDYSIVPAPSAAAVLGAGAIAFGRRRRK
jgi:hypothetical protein